MDGAQDMGGVHGFGRIVPEPNEPVFHADWERRAFALTLAMARPGGWNIDMSRYARENRSHGDYLSKSYFEIWLAGLERLMADRGLVSADEIDAGRVLHERKDVPVLPADGVATMLRNGAPTERAASAPARFKIGDRVRTRNTNPPTHTRLPRYVRGHAGVVTRVHGVHVFADKHAHGEGESPDWLYTVQFGARELWGDGADASATMSVDAWQPYLEPAS